MDEIASSLLRDRKAYVLAKVSKHETTEEEILENIVIDGACIRTPDEDIVWVEKQKEIVFNDLHEVLALMFRGRIIMSNSINIQN